MKTGKKIAILQSNYIPWKGYFDIINSVDEFILFDDAQYTKNDWRNRNKIKAKNGLIWLTIPIRQSFGQKIRDARVTNQKWRKKHWRSISESFTRSPYFNEYRQNFEELYLSSNESFLSKINYLFITTICDILKINTKLSWSAEYKILPDKNDRLISLCKQASASSYLSGPSAKNYIDEKIFDEEGIRLTFMDYSNYPEYHQLHPPFTHFISIIDLIFNEGPNAPDFMKSFK
jgi:hypothetical protein